LKRVPQPMKPDDPAYWMLQDGFTTTPKIHRRGCYICEDPEFAQMGMPLCSPCPKCSTEQGQIAGHIAADDTVCDDCGHDIYPPEFDSDGDVPSVTSLPDIETYTEQPVVLSLADVIAKVRADMEQDRQS